MNNAYLRLDKLINFLKWEKLQNDMSHILKLAILLVDYKGVPISSHSGCQHFCQKIRLNPYLNSFCKKCDARGGVEAARTGMPYIYNCHFGITDVAIPIIVEDKYLGALMVGQVRVKDKENTLETLVHLPEKLREEALELFAEEYNALPVLSYDEVLSSASFIQNLMSYMIDESLEKNLALDLYSRERENPFKDYKNIANVQNLLNESLVNTRIKSTANNIYQCKNKQLKPVFEYLYEHKNENLSLASAAELSNFSPSYFSRIFSKETGESYSSFTAKLKMTWAKELLENSEYSINQVSELLGFCESGYFIKAFKRSEGMTPFVYRKHYNNVTEF